ncbi:MAG: protease modulator HflK, partial [Betaproteobacteria bacterium]|nr:protease modulator HflK [Betaproteobacteria bacterium]
MRVFLRRVFSLNDPGWGRSGSQGSGQGSNQPGQQNQDTPGRDERRNRRPDAPPDLDELWRDFNRKLNQVFRGGKGNGPRGPSSGGAGF